MEIAIIILLAALLIIREYQYRKVEKDLMDRIMCRNWDEYKKNTKPRTALPGNPTFMTDEDLYNAEKKKGK